MNMQANLRFYRNVKIPTLFRKKHARLLVIESLIFLVKFAKTANLNGNFTEWDYYLQNQ
ncbi:hypothetical protein LEP1GSC036_3980 [Leptospira weilii str. 2006001853]|uniref:Uncharacterized protein n=2 Tax=Leptospira weilii TaxID=28184 RepID=A0A828Z8X3_9LEPT|nr:hypothetical protein LEP1GSC036_3980 [Leptospira weilii str. 2006001853]EMM74790.1 hypothetical protein LEP1GSC038_0738 [Leptospira weilii str. 2006001855]EMN43383.1 hypothetical protein LEP1GSC086_1677 [Leptospira weilii str. LNT 1234]